MQFKSRLQKFNEVDVTSQKKFTNLFDQLPFANNSVAVMQFKSRLQTFNEVDTTSQKKFTNFGEILKSENGAALSGIKSASITTSQITRVYDAATYGG